ncbi:MAG: YbhB/YbcL family Raf kinase inhibitor-like protein [Thermoprotei archaeon]
MIFRRKIQDPLEIVRKEAGEVIRVESVFKNGERIPVKYTCEGSDVSPPLRLSNIPSGTVELALVMYDPDAPIGTFYHWLLYGISPDKTELPEGILKEPETSYGLQGINDFGDYGYGGPCPPPGHGTHRYYFLVVALKEKTGLKPGVRINDLMDRVKGKILGYGVLMGTYSR